jgi:predicted peroxiredoxin
MEPPVERVHAQFVEKGGRFYVCPICFNERDLDEGDLVESAELKGATPLMEFADEGAVTFSY